MSSLTSHPSPNQVSVLRQSIESSLDTLANAIDEVQASELFTRYLDIQAQFHRYSWHNSMLIAQQFPEATNVAGYSTWKKLGRQVRKGEKAVKILAPCRMQWSELDDDGVQRQINHLFFKVVNVFDISQTDGNPIPKFEIPDITTKADKLLVDLELIAKKRNITVEYKNLKSGHYGSSKGGLIDIAVGYESGQQAKTLAHELAHELLHKKHSLGLTHSQAELEAEAVAYVICKHFGLDVSIRASHYIVMWNGDSKMLRASLERISKTAKLLIEEIESLYERKVAA